MNTPAPSKDQAFFLIGWYESTLKRELGEGKAAEIITEARKEAAETFPDNEGVA